MDGYGDFADRRKKDTGYPGGERRVSDLWQMVIEHHAVLAQMGGDITHIKKRIDLYDAGGDWGTSNGLASRRSHFRAGQE